MALHIKNGKILTDDEYYRSVAHDDVTAEDVIAWLAFPTGLLAPFYLIFQLQNLVPSHNKFNFFVDIIGGFCLYVVLFGFFLASKAMRVVSACITVGVVLYFFNIIFKPFE